MDIKDSYLHSAIGVVKSIDVGDGKLSYTLADVGNTRRTFDLSKAASIPFIVGTQAPSEPNSKWSTGKWTGNAPTIASKTDLYDGLTIRYWLPYNGSGEATLNLVFDDGSNTGDLECYYRGTTRLTTHVTAGTPVTLTYRKNPVINGEIYAKEGWWMDGDYDSDSGLYKSYSVKAFKTGASDISAYNLIGVNKDGLLVSALTTPFLVDGPLYIRTSSLTKNKEYSWANLWERTNSITIKNGSTNLSLTTYKPLYLKGEIDNGLFTAIEYTQILPTTEDGKAYLYIGEAVSSTSISFSFIHPIYIYKGGTIQTYSGYSTLSSRATLADTVSCTVGSSNAYRPIVVTNESSGLFYNSKITANYETGDLKATTFTGNLIGSANKVANSLILRLNSGSTEGTNKYTFDGSSAKTLDIKSGAGIALSNSAGVTNIINTGVRSITTGTTNGTISVNTNGTFADVAVKGLGSNAFGNNFFTKDVAASSAIKITFSEHTHATIFMRHTFGSNMAVYHVSGYGKNEATKRVSIVEVYNSCPQGFITTVENEFAILIRNTHETNALFVSGIVQRGGITITDTTSDITENGLLAKLLNNKNTYINSGTITINGTSITPLTSHQSLANYVTLNTAQTITGAKTFTASTNVFKGEGVGMLTVNRNSTKPAWVKFMKDTTTVGYLGIRNDGTPTYGNSEGVSYVLLHSGNYTDYLGYIGTTAVQSTSKAQALTGITKLTFTESSDSYIGTTNGYLSINSHSNEICISGTMEDILYINYRKSLNEKAPETWHWKAGSSTSWANFELGNLTSSGLTTTKTLKISSTDAESHIAFSRGSHNYITTPSGGNIHIIPNGGSVSSTAGFIFGGSSLYPGVTNTRSLGTSDLRWTNVYSIAGNYTGDITASKFITSGGTSAQFVKGDGSLDDSCYKYRNAYDYRNGYLVKLDITDSVNYMCNIHITGNSYNNGTPINTYLEFYAYYGENSTLQYRATHYGLNFGNIQVFLYNKNYYLWFEQPNVYTSFSIYANISNNNKSAANSVLSISDQSMPTEGISRHVTVVPTVNNDTLYIEGTGTSEGVWLGEHPRITKYQVGLTILYKIPISGKSSGVTLNINNLGAKSCKWGTSNLTTHYSKNNVILFVYDGTNFVTPTNYNWCVYVNQYKTNDSTAKYPVLFRYNTGDPSNGTNVNEYTRYDSEITIHPSTNTIHANTFEGSLSTLVTNNLNNTWKPGQVLAWFTNVSQDNGYAGNNTGFPSTNNANGILWLGTHSGSTEDVLGYGHQLGFSSNKRIYHRAIVDTLPTTTNGGSWFKIAYTTDNFPSNQINALTGYAKATSAANLATTDSLNTALGKLEYKADTAYSFITGANDGDETIENLKEILDVLTGIKATDTISALINACVKKAGDTMSGTFTIAPGTNVGLVIHRKGSIGPLVKFYGGENGNTLYGYLGFSNTNTPTFYNTSNSANTLLHAGNYTSYKHAYTNLTGSGTTANQAIVSTGTKDGWTLKTLGSRAFDSTAYLPIAGGTMALGEGLKFHSDENYFGTNSDARIISLLDVNGTTCDGGLIIDERATNNGTETITELLRIRDSEFKWKGSDILHANNYTTYTVKKDGTGATGTWGINISGVASKVSCTATSDNTTRPIVLTNTSSSLYYTTKATINYSTGNITAPTFTGNLVGSANKFDNLSSYVFNYRTTLAHGRYNKLFSFYTSNGEKSSITFNIHGKSNGSGHLFYAEYQIQIEYKADWTDASERTITVKCLRSTGKDLSQNVKIVKNSYTGSDNVVRVSYDVYADLGNDATKGELTLTGFVYTSLITRTPSAITSTEWDALTAVATSTPIINYGLFTANNLVTARKFTIGNTEKSFDGTQDLSWSSAEIGYRHEWRALVKCATWSRLCYVVYGNSTTGSSYIINIKGTRDSVVYNYTYLVTAHHGAYRSNIVQIGGSNYNNISVRVCVSTQGTSYFELYDTARDATSATTQYVNCTLIPISCGRIDKYIDTFTDGTTITEGFTAGTQFDSKAYSNSIQASNFVGNLIGNVTGNVTGSASKWATARTITLGGLLQGSVDLDGSSNVTLNSYNYYSTTGTGDTNNYPYHRILKSSVITADNSDHYGMYRITQGYDTGYMGVFEVYIRHEYTKSDGTKLPSKLTIKWLYRRGIPIDTIQAGFNSTYKNTFVDVFYKCSYGWRSAIIEQISDTKGRGSVGRAFELVNSAEVSSYSDKENYEVYQSISSGISGRTYTEIVIASDSDLIVGSANKVNSTLTFAAGTFSAKTFNGSAAVTVNVPTKTSHLTNDSGYLTSRGYIGTTAVQANSAAQALTGITNLSMSGLISINNTTGGTDLGTIIQGKTYKIGFLIGSGNENRGIYDYNNNKWALNLDGSGNVKFTGTTYFGGGTSYYFGKTGDIKCNQLTTVNNAFFNSSVRIQNGTRYPDIRFYPKVTGLTSDWPYMGQIYYDVGSTEKYAGSRFFFRQYSYDSTATTPTRLSTYVDYFLPHVAADLESSYSRYIALSTSQMTLYASTTTVNGTAWAMAGTSSGNAFTIFAPTTAGTAGQVLVSSGNGAPTWGSPSGLTAGSLTPIQLFSGSVSVSSSGWTDIGTGTSTVKFDSRDTGTYAIQITSGTNFVASGVFSVYKNLSNVSDEIPLHVCTSKSTRLYLRTMENKLQIASNDTSATSWSITIKIAKIL